MSSLLRKELLIYIVLLLFLALLMHPDLLENPSSRIALMIDRGNFYHPFIYTFIIYSVFSIFRFILKKMLLLISKFRNR